jgi:hypothetical protein
MVQYITRILLVALTTSVLEDTCAQVNYDESKVPVYQLPELLTTSTGYKIESAADWMKIRRPEILKIFEDEVYGKIPDHAPSVSFSVIKNYPDALCGKATMKEVLAAFTNGRDTLQMNLLVLIPNDRQRPVPLFLGMNFYGNHTIHMDTAISITKNYVGNNVEFCIFNNRATTESRGVRSSRWPVETILARGYGLATIYYGDLDPDFDDGFENGIHHLMDKKPGPDEWGSISAWAWGLSKAVDYFETDPDVDEKRVILLGHSRLGKTALWAGAIDQRFAAVISNNSGCGGAALSRRRFGETVEAINTRFPHWFCRNFHAYNDREDYLPVDQHMLIALIAPRPVYVASAENDKWADPKGEYLSLFHAGPVYRLFGYQVFAMDTMPRVNQPVSVGQLGYHIRSGDHDITRFDWERYLDFADKHVKVPR